MKWAEINIHTSREAVEPISNILQQFDTGGVVIKDPLDITKEKSSLYGEIYDINMAQYPSKGVYVLTYLPSDELLDAKIKQIKQKIDQLSIFHINLGENKITIQDIDEEDWTTSWKKYYKPIKVSDKIIISPTWEQYKKNKDEIIIELDPGMAFGTGTHPTTTLSILALEDNLKMNDLVIDVGSGSGVLSIAAALLGAKFVHAFDLDNIAVKSTRLNAKLNNLNDKITVKKNNLLEGINLKANIIVSNILAEVIMKFPQDAWNNLLPGGLFITSGIILKKKETVKKELRAVGFEIVNVHQIENWISIIAKKP